MSSMSKTDELKAALIEWKDAGGSIDDVVWAITDLVREEIQEETSRSDNE